MELYLIRHPRVAAPDGVCYGQSDWPLAEDAAAIAARLWGELPSSFHLYASPSERAAALARELGRPSYDDRLLEMNFGAWEGVPFETIDPALIEQWAQNPFGFQPPQGESAAEMSVRVLEWWRETYERRLEAEAIVVVGHAGPFKAIAGHLLGLPRERWLALEFECARSTRLDVQPWGVILKWFNR